MTAKKCPECGDFLVFSFAKHGFGIACETCGRETRMEISLQGAIMAWNEDKVRNGA